MTFQNNEHKLCYIIYSKNIYIIYNMVRYVVLWACTVLVKSNTLHTIQEILVNKTHQWILYNIVYKSVLQKPKWIFSVIIRYFQTKNISFGWFSIIMYMYIAYMYANYCSLIGVSYSQEFPVYTCTQTNMPNIDSILPGREFYVHQ
jgi:hypothetical protein